MTKFLLRILTKNQDPTSPAARSAIGKLSGTVGILTNLLLCVGKLMVGTLSGSLSITADAMNNLSDASSSIVTLLGFKLAEKPADADHPYGHARYEYLSALVVAAMILVIGFELAKTSVEKILNPAPVQFTLVTGLVLAGSMAVKLWLASFNITLGKQIGSSALEASGADSRNDVIATGTVLLAGLVEHFTSWQIDGVMGLGVALFILYSGAMLARETVSPLLGEAATPELKALIVDYVSSHPKVLGYHDLMVHDYGPGRRFASLHVEMDNREDPLLCHEIIDDMERECYQQHNVHLVIHYDPVVTDDPELNRLQDIVAAHLAQVDPTMRLHDFRMVRGTGHTNLIFDVSFPNALRGQEATIRSGLETMLRKTENKTYYCVITFDPMAFNTDGI